MPDKISHFELPVSDLAKSRKFYNKVLGWKFTKAPMPGFEYWLIDTGSKEVGGGMYKKTDPKQGPVNYASVKSIDATVKKFKSAGGKVISPKQEIPEVGWVAIGVDHEGNSIGFWQDKPKRTSRHKAPSKR